MSDGQMKRVAGALSAALLACSFSFAQPAKYASNPPLRPLPAAFDRPMDKGRAFFADAAKGDDKNAGTQDAPWKTVARTLKQLKAGDTLYLRAGTYYESVLCESSGAKDAPITLRAYPNELAIIDAGYREFLEDPANAWEPYPAGAPGEYRSKKAYPGLGEDVDPRHGVFAMGNFADSMVPLHGYFTLLDLRTDNLFANLDNNMTTAAGLYCGPGLWYDARVLGDQTYGTKRIHVRLAHTKWPALGAANYSGETDPRNLPLVIGGPDPALELKRARFIRVQDLVLRGSRDATLELNECEGVELDGLTAYGGAPTLKLRGNRNVRIVNSAFRGVSAPWSSRYAEKYRGVSTYLVTTGGRGTDNDEIEMSWSEFTDSHDGLEIYGVNRLRFHHNLCDNFNDDGIEPGPKKAQRDLWVYQNLISRCLLTFSLHGGSKPGPVIESAPGSGVYIFRNVIDLRPPIRKTPPRAADAPEEAGTLGNLCSDHGSPIWPNYYFYQNTVLAEPPPWRNHYAFGFGARGTNGNKRGVFNNIFVTAEGAPGMVITAGEGYQFDGNLHWGVKDGAKAAAGFFDKYRKSKTFEESKKWYAPGWAANDLCADPKFLKPAPDWRAPMDLRLPKDSPAVGAGVPLPPEWPDPLRAQGKPDIGALPLGAEPLKVGVRGRIDMMTR
jgi:hypothetical protein